MDTTWSDMPLHGGDPESALVGVLVQTHVWRKIGEKHMANPREPWGEWLGASMASTFQALWPLGCQNDDDRKVVEDVSSRIRQDALVSLAAPLFMKYRYCRIGAAEEGDPQRLGSLSDPEPSQRLVLPSGARVEIRQDTRGGWSMRSCYFDDDVAGQDVPDWLRYRRLVGKLRGRYLVAPGGSGASTVDPYLKDDSIETGIEFVSRYNWGLESSNPPDPWNHLPPPWPQPPAVPPAPPPGLLRPPPPGGGTTT
jgi:hypothetical protein